MSILTERGKVWALPCLSVCNTLQAQVGGNLGTFQTPFSLKGYRGSTMLA